MKNNSLKLESMFSVARNESMRDTDFTCSTEHADCLLEYQGNTNYCWMYTGVSIIKRYLKDKYNKEIGFSYAYVQFYDKLEKAYLAIENIIDKKYKNADGTSTIISTNAPD